MAERQQVPVSTVENLWLRDVVIDWPEFRIETNPLVIVSEILNERGLGIKIKRGEFGDVAIYASNVAWSVIERLRLNPLYRAIWQSLSRGLKPEVEELDISGELKRGLLDLHEDPYGLRRRKLVYDRVQEVLQIDMSRVKKMLQSSRVGTSGVIDFSSIIQDSERQVEGALGIRLSLADVRMILGDLVDDQLNVETQSSPVTS